jgi:hypothetical protein
MSKSKSRGDVCFKCGEFRGAIMDGPLYCWDGYDELGRHRFSGPEPRFVICPRCEVGRVVSEPLDDFIGLVAMHCKPCSLIQVLEEVTR